MIQFQLGPICYAESTNVGQLECANGNLGDTWDGCLHQNSVRVRCPKNNFPCNAVATNKQEFKCKADCSEHGGIKECFTEGILHNCKLKFILAHLCLKNCCLVALTLPYSFRPLHHWRKGEG